MPEDRLDDCVWLDLEENLIPLDFMSAPPGQEESVIADLQFILTNGMSLDTAPNIKSNLHNLIYTLLDANQHPHIPDGDRCTFLDLGRFFQEPDRKDKILEYVRNPTLKRFGRDEYPEPADRKRILSRMTPFLLSKTMSAIFGDPRPRFSIAEIIDKKKILLVHLPLKNPYAPDYGALLFSKIQHEIFSRDCILEDDRTPMYLYIDEFQNFRSSEHFDRVLEMARSFKLCLTLASLSVAELPSDITTALGVISSRVIFKISPEDQSYFAKIIGNVDPAENTLAKINQLKVKWDVTHDPKVFVQLQIEREYLTTLPQCLTVKDAVKLRKYEAIYLIGDEPAVKEPIPSPPAKRPTPEQQKKLAHIKAHTRKEYGPLPSDLPPIFSPRIMRLSPVFVRLHQRCS